MVTGPSRVTKEITACDRDFTVFRDHHQQASNRLARNISIMKPIPQSIIDMMQNDEFRRGLDSLTKLGDKFQPLLRKAAKEIGATSTGTLQQKVEAQSALGYVGHSMSAVMLGGAGPDGSSLSAKGIVNKRSPPVQEGITACVERVYKAVVEDFPHGRANFAPIPALLRRVRYLLRIFYDFKVASKRSPDLKFVDFDQIYDVAFRLHHVGLYLQLDPPRLRALMSAAGKDIETFILDDPLDLGPYRREADNIRKVIEDDEEAGDSDREGLQQIEDLAHQDLAAHVFTWFIADVHVAFVVNEPKDDEERRYAEKAIKRLVKWSTSATWRDVLGDPLTDAMRPIYHDQQALVRFAQAGGLGALYGDWVNSLCTDFCHQVLLKLPNDAWENQNKSTLRGITRQIQSKEEYEGKSILKGPIFINTFHQIYSRHGIAPFQYAAKFETFQTSILFYFISHRIKTDSLKMTSPADWRVLIQSYIDLPDAIERRYRWSNLNIAGKWDCIQLYGCDNDLCEEKQKLLRARDKRVRGVRDAELEERLHKWGAKSKACARCKGSSYCSTSCQKVHWSLHKLKCQPTRVIQG